MLDGLLDPQTRAIVSSRKDVRSATCGVSAHGKRNLSSGAPGGIRTPDPQIRSLGVSSELRRNATYSTPALAPYNRLRFPPRNPIGERYADPQTRNLAIGNGTARSTELVA
jgi:hypothetical protein